jgi:hypothetical protein
MSLPRPRLRIVALLPAALGLALLLAACGASANANGASAATATATCPPATRNVATVTGAISATASGSITVSAANGKTTVVHLAATTSIRKLTTLPASSLTAGTAVQVQTDTDVTTAQRILLTPASASGTATPGVGFGRGKGTPPAGVNSNCLRRGGGVQGTPASGFPGQNAFRGVRGTVDSATSTQLIMEDAQGQVYHLAIISSTLIETTSSGSPSDLVVGASVTCTGTSASDGSVTARSIIVAPAGA